jgi:hypothetical protein
MTTHVFLSPAQAHLERNSRKAIADSRPAAIPGSLQRPAHDERVKSFELQTVY